MRCDMVPGIAEKARHTDLVIVGPYDGKVAIAWDESREGQPFMAPGPRRSRASDSHLSDFDLAAELYDAAGWQTIIFHRRT